MDAAEYASSQTQTGVPAFWAAKHAKEASQNWDKFYKRNTTNFYKHRHWTTDTNTDGFPCLSPSSPTVLVEAGCGVANAAIPLLKNENLSIFAFDFAPTAVRLVRETPEYNTSRLHAFVWDFCAVSLLDGVDATERGSLTVGGADLVSLIFVLSAVPPSLHVCGARHLLQLLKPGGRLLFRDYATGDLAETRFAPRNKIKDKYYVRQDSTLSYFFDEETLRCTMVEAGFQEVYVRRIHRVVRNRKEKLEMHRVFLQGEFIKANT